MKLRGSILPVLFVLAVPAFSAEEAIPWIDKPAAALKAAGESGKPVLADVWAVWCQPCKALAPTIDGQGAIVGNFFTGDVVRVNLADGSITQRANIGQKRSLSGVAQFP